MTNKQRRRPTAGEKLDSVVGASEAVWFVSSRGCLREVAARLSVLNVPMFL